MLALTLNLVGKSNCWVSSRRRHTKWVVSHMFEEKQIYMTLLHWLSHHSFHYYNTSTCITLVFTPLLSLLNLVVHQLTVRISSIVFVNTYSQSCHLLIVHISTFVIAWFIILLHKLLLTPLNAIDKIRYLFSFNCYKIYNSKIFDFP